LSDGQDEQSRILLPPETGEQPSLSSGLSDAPWLSRRRPGSLYSIIESSFNTNKRGDEQEEELFLLLLLPRASVAVAVRRPASGQWTVEYGVSRYPRGPTGGNRFSRDPTVEPGLGLRIKRARVFRPRDRACQAGTTLGRGFTRTIPIYGNAGASNGLHCRGKVRVR